MKKLSQSNEENKQTHSIYSVCHCHRRLVNKNYVKLLFSFGIKCLWIVNSTATASHEQLDRNKISLLFMQLFLKP